MTVDLQPDAHAKTDLRVSKIFDGRYVLLRELGRGGMGAVYVAFDVRQMRRVALKRIEPRHGVVTRMFEERFHREVRALAAIKHPGVPALYYDDRAGRRDDGALFFTMEIVAGERLSGVLARERIAPVRALSLAIDLGRILMAAHEAGVIHRDVKPGNILIEPGDRVRLIDFGACAVLPQFFLREEVEGDKITATTDRWATGDHEAVVTPGYSAPEVGRQEDATVRSDIYSVCAVLYEMIAGRPLFDKHAYCLRTIHPDEFVPELAPLAEVMRLGVSHELWERPHSMAELVQSLEIVRAGLLRARVDAVRRWRPVVATAVPASLAAGILVLAWTGGDGPGPRTEPPPVVEGATVGVAASSPPGDDSEATEVALAERPELPPVLPPAPPSPGESGASGPELAASLEPPRKSARQVRPSARTSLDPAVIVAALKPLRSCAPGGDELRLEIGVHGGRASVRSINRGRYRPLADPLHRCIEAALQTIELPRTRHQLQQTVTIP